MAVDTLWIPIRESDPAKGARSGLGSSAEGLLACVADLGIDEIHAPIGGRPLSMVVSPAGYRSVHSSEFHAFEFAKAEPVRRAKRKRAVRNRR